MSWTSKERPRGARAGTVAVRSALRVSRPAHPREMRRIRQLVDEWASGHALPVSVLIDLQIALGEAVANGVEHAYRGTRPGMVDVDLAIRRTGPDPAVLVRVADHGRWRPVPEDNGYRGRGLAVIERVARDVVVSRTRQGTEICFGIPLDG